ncbi:MAG TPA: nickel pincer cofactor biosynthesis protein LarB [Acidobacteriota bacterium]|nr:nickel pincer cofactor biosynthesis protein LarB [Acidobacteriota bacterium]
MDYSELIRLLEDYKNSRINQEQALDVLKRLPYEDLGFARIDHHRQMRRGLPEVVFGSGKTPEQIGEIVARMKETGVNILVTRTSREVFDMLAKRHPQAQFNESCGAVTIRQKSEITGKGEILVVAAGTADLPVAEEAYVTADLFGNTTVRLYDVGVAGLHRLLSERERLVKARVIIVAAGMEGALPSVVAGLVAVPVIGVPTSIGYGTHFGGVAPLLAMLNSCAGLAVVNIDNGFGAAQFASIINHL